MTDPSTNPSEAAPPHDAARFARHVSGYTAAVGVSRVLGFARDAGVMYLFGAGTVTDAFYAAFRIANLFRRTLGEGSLNSSFVPVLAAERLRGPGHVRAFMGALWSGVLLAAGALSLAGLVLARPLVLALTYGFRSNADQLALTVGLTRVFFVHVFLVILAAVCQGSLNTAKRFFLPALAPTAFSGSIIAYLAALHFGLLRFASPHGAVYGLAWTAALSGLLTLAVLVPATRREGFLGGLRRPLSHPGVLQVLALMGPSMVGMATDQLDAFVDTICASFLAAGSLTAIYNATRLMQLPLALFGVATAAVALPHLSEHAGRGEMERFGETLHSALRLLAFLLLPAAAGLICLSLPVTRLLFEHGLFTPEASLRTSGALTFYCLGLPAYAATKVLVSSFYSLKEAATPVKIALVETAVNAAVSVALMRPLGVSGLALGAAAGAWTGCALNFHFLHKRTGFAGAPADWGAVLKSAAAAAAMAALVWAVRFALAGRSPLVQVACGIGAGVPFYFALASALDIKERHLALQFFRRGSAPPEGTPSGIRS